jgi:hypothetical protein
MKQSTAEALKRAGDWVGVEVTIHPDYSGRGMFGKTTVAIELEAPSELSVLVAVATKMYVSDVDFKGFLADVCFKQDKMGHGVILY